MVYDYNHFLSARIILTKECNIFFGLDSAKWHKANKRMKFVLNYLLHNFKHTKHTSNLPMFFLKILLYLMAGSVCPSSANPCYVKFFKTLLTRPFPLLIFLSAQTVTDILVYLLKVRTLFGNRATFLFSVFPSTSKQNKLCKIFLA